MKKSRVTPKAAPDNPAWWLKPLSEPHAELATDAAGLSSAEARSRLAEFGPNLFRDHRERPLVLQFLSRFKNPLVLLLLVAQHVCAQLNIPMTGVLTGKEIEPMDDQALRARVEKVNLFCRVNPSQKDRVILALKARGHVVGYLGDGINDAPSLHSADVGLSVDSAVDVAKEAADMILLDQDLNVLHDGVLEGRRTFGNIMKYIMMGTSSNFGNMFSMAGAALFLPFLPMLPTQILLNNILYDLSEVPIPLDKVDPMELQRPRVLDMNFIRDFMLVIGPVSSAFDFLTFYVMLTVLKADEALFQTGWFVESLATQVLVIFIIRTRGNPFKSRAHPILAATSLAMVAIGAALPFTPLGTYFGFVPPPARFYLILAAMVAVYLAMVELAKRGFYRWHRISGKPRKAMGWAALKTTTLG